MILPTIRASVAKRAGSGVCWTTRESRMRCSLTPTYRFLPRSSSTCSCGRLYLRGGSMMRAPPTTSHRFWSRSVGGRQRKNGASTGQPGLYEPQGLSFADQGPFGKGESVESELRHQRPSDGLIIDVSPTDEDVAQPPSGTLLLVQRCAQVPLFEPPRVHKRLPEPKGSCGHRDTLEDPRARCHDRIGQVGPRGLLDYVDYSNGSDYSSYIEWGDGLPDHGGY